MKESNTIIIFDWDDTLFPTSWTVDNSIDLSDSDTQNKFIVYFSRLDMLLYKLLMNCLKNNSNIYIVTNATIKWINISLSMLPNTKKIIDKNVKVLSARDLHQENNTKMEEWKKLTFLDIHNNKYKNYKKYQIVSVGDAEYEYNALINLFNQDSVSNQRILKTVKLLKNPSFDSLVDQLEVLNSCIDKIIKRDRHLDLKFKDHNF